VRFGITALIAWLFLTAITSRAQEPALVEIKAVAEVRTQVPSGDGRMVWRFLPAAELRQGDEVFFTLDIRNTSPVVAPDVEVIWPVPANTVYVRGSASGPAAEISFSVDGGHTFARGTQLRARDASGSERPATERDYTHIRWRLRYPLAPQAVALARFRAIFR
jgi:uncharacterized repeat protein (TIGR01451 family)